MSDAAREIARLQAEYEKMEQEGEAKFGTKARASLEKQLRDEMKKKLDALGGDRDAFKARKGRAFAALQSAKERRREEVVAGVKAGTIAPDAARAEIVALGWASGVADAVVAKALKGDAPAAVVTAAAPPPEPSPEHEEILDPVGAKEPVAREEVYAEPGRPPEPDAKGKGGKGGKSK